MSEFLTCNLNAELALSRTELHDPPPNADAPEFKAAYGAAKADRARLLGIVDHLLSMCSALKADRDSAHHGWQATRNSLTAAEAKFDAFTWALPSFTWTMGGALKIHEFGDVSVRVSSYQDEHNYVHLSHLVNLWSRCSPIKVRALESDKNALAVANAELKRDLAGTTEALKAAEAKLLPPKDTVGRLTMENGELRRLKTHADNVEIERLQQENAKLTRELEQTKAALTARLADGMDKATIKYADLAKYIVEITPEERIGWDYVLTPWGTTDRASVFSSARTMKLDELVARVEKLEGRLDAICGLADLDQETDEE